MPQWQPVSQQTNSASTDPTLATLNPSDILDEDLFTTDNESTAATTPASDETAQSLSLDSPWITVAEEETGTKPPMLSRLWQSHIKGASNTVETATHLGQSHSKKMENSVEIETTPHQKRHIDASPAPTALQSTLSSAISHTEQLSSPLHQNPLTEDIGPDHARKDISDSWLPQRTTTASNPPDGQTIDPQQTRQLPHLRIVGQMAQSYIVAEGEDGSMYLLDQHAAHERILLERMVAAMKSRQSLSQLLLTPINLALAPSELAAIEEHQWQLEQLGFSYTIAENSTLEIRAVPSVLVKHMNVRSLHELLVDLTCEESLGATETWEEQALANVACKAAIKANYFLTVSEMREMIEQLGQTRAPYSCCHGRPTMVHFSPSALAHAFERR